MISPTASSAINHAARSAAFAHWFGLDRRCAELLVVLYQADGHPLTAKQIAVLVASTDAAVIQRMHHLRRAMEAEAIDRDERGYWLTEVARKDIIAATEAMIRSLAA